MFRQLTTNRGFYLPFLALLIIGALVLIYTDKAEVHLLLTSFHHPFLDTVMYYLTWLGDGWLITGLTVCTLLFRYRMALLLALGNLLGSAITQSLKHYVFDDHDRPYEFFRGLADLHIVPGLDIHSHYSFPSGHATLAFATCAILASFARSPWIKVSFFALALLTAYTRVYLSQHFFNDIYAGAAIGTVSALVVLSIWREGKEGGFLDRSLLRN